MAKVTLLLERLAQRFKEGGGTMVMRWNRSTHAFLAGAGIALAAALLLAPHAEAEETSRVRAVRIGAGNLVVIAVKAGELKPDGTFKSRSGQQLDFHEGKLQKATNNAGRKVGVDRVKTDSSGKLVLSAGGSDWYLADGDYRRRGENESSDPRRRAWPSPESMKVTHRELVQVSYKAHIFEPETPIPPTLTDPER